MTTFNTDSTEIPIRYDDLVARFGAPRPIHDDVGAENATEIIDLLAGRELNQDQEDYLDAWAVMMLEYEGEWDEPLLTGIDLLKALMDDRGMRNADLARLLGVDPSLCSRILSGQRSLTIAQIKKLSAHFALNPAALLG